MPAGIRIKDTTLGNGAVAARGKVVYVHVRMTLNRGFRLIVAAGLACLILPGCATTARLPSPAGTEHAVAAAVQAKMRAIIFPEFWCEDATLAQAFAFLKRRMQELDPAGEGISIIVQLAGRLDPGVVLGAPQPWAAAQEEPPLPEPSRQPYPVPPSSFTEAPEEPRLTLHLRNVTLEEVVERLCLAASLKWTLTPKLTIGPAGLLKGQR